MKIGVKQFKKEYKKINIDDIEVSDQCRYSRSVLIGNAYILS